MSRLAAMIPALFVTLLAQGCAPTGVTRQPAAAHAVSTSRQAYAFEGVHFAGVRAGQLSASREWSRADANREVARDDAAELRARLMRDLSTHVRFDDNAPIRLRATLILQAPGYFEGLAAETSDLTLAAQLFDANGTPLRTITLRESASAPMQRGASRLSRFEQAVDRLATRLAAEL